MHPVADSIHSRNRRASGLPLFSLQVSYTPSKLKERSGDIALQAWPLGVEETEQNLAANGKVPVGDRVAVGDYFLSFKEVRYWVGMTVRHDPGTPVVLTSLWVALFGMITTFIGRIRKSRQ